MAKILVTGGSGFIGTNVIEHFLSRGYEVLNIDIARPQDINHNHIYKDVDILNLAGLKTVFKDFSPEYVIHLAARTDLHEKKDINGYLANTKGVENMVAAISVQNSVERCIFASTKLVCPTDYTPKSTDDYCPNTLYGRSKVLGEKILKNSTTMQCDWCIVRPTSIWGPWSISPHIPYGTFFQMISRGRYFHPGYSNPTRSFGYVGNVVFQFEKLLEATREQIHKQVFYMTDYDTFTIQDWADTISMKLKGRKVKVLPDLIVQLFAWAGDIMKFCGIKEPPFSSFRLANMRADTSGIPTGPIEKITGPLPYSMEQGVEETIAWLQEYELIK
jgi:nucleoside-diphosphate-sugar epimerase